MTNPAILEALTAKMEEIWNDDLSFEDQAAAVLELVGPKPLVWSMPDKNGWRRAGEYHLGPCNTAERQWGFGLVLSKISWHPTIESAQAAAQAHADAAHWANCPLGKLAGVV